MQAKGDAGFTAKHITFTAHTETKIAIISNFTVNELQGQTMAKYRKDVTNIGNLDKKVQDILYKYADDIATDLEEVTMKVADAGVKEIRANARKYKWGNKYINGWTKTDISTRFNKGVVIHHSTAAGLPHLLEFGHLHYANGKRTGGSTGKFEHIKPVEDKLIDLYQKEVKSKL